MLVLWRENHSTEAQLTKNHRLMTSYLNISQMVVDSTNGATSTSEQSISSLNASLFKGLISQPRLLAILQSKDAPTETEACETLRQEILAKLKNNNVEIVATIEDLLKLSSTALLHIVDPCLTYVECNQFITRLRELCSVAPVTALSVRKRAYSEVGISSFNGKLSTGLPTLDSRLHGGFQVCSITEIVGRAGVGKTHLSQQLCVLAATSGDGGAIYIDTENKMSVFRLKEIAMERGYKRRRIEAESSISTERDPAEIVLENVTVHTALTTHELIDTIDQLDKEITQRNIEANKYSSDPQYIAQARRLPVHLLIIDSIAAPLRRDYSTPNTAMHRASYIFEIARKLKQLADKFQLAVVVVNQVGGVNSEVDNVQRNDTLDINDGEFIGSLGTVWQHCVSTRISLEHDCDLHKLEQYQSANRKVVITKSLVSKRIFFNFDVTRRGVREVTLES